MWLPAGIASRSCQRLHGQVADQSNTIDTSLMTREAKTTSSLAEILKSFPCGQCELTQAIPIVGSGRSGTTWLGEILSEIPGSALLFEPLHLKQVPEAAAAGFSWSAHVRPGTDWPQGEEYLKDVLRGNLITEWTAKDMVLNPEHPPTFIVAKFIRANRLLGWFCECIPTRKPVLILRHPCAVVASQLREGSWNNKPKPILPSVYRDFPVFEKITREINTSEEVRAINWALDTFLPLAQGDLSKFILVTYERLVLDFDRQVNSIFDSWGLPVPVATHWRTAHMESQRSILPSPG